MNIALVDWNWTGHHPTYFCQFASALVELGARVLPLCPDPEDFLRRLPATPSGARGLQEGRLLSPEPCRYAPPLPVRPRRLSPLVQGARHFSSLGKRLGRWRDAEGRALDWVFFACVYDHQFEWLRFAWPGFKTPWSGLYLHARAFRLPGTPLPYTNRLPCPEKIFASPALRSVAVLDETAVAPLERITGGKPVVAFPDLADTTLPAPDAPAGGLARKLQGFASGRPVLSLVGHLQRTKGLREFTELAADPDNADLCFFLGGELSWHDTPPETVRWMTSVWEQQPNVLTHFQRLDEPPLNAVLAATSVIFAAYTDFPNSSNILTKAAFLRRPILVSEGHLMAERVSRHQLGLAVPEGEVAAMKPALRALLSQPPADEDARARYLEAHSYPALLRAFARLTGLGGGSEW